MNLLPDIDKNETRAKARAVLMSYRMLNRRLSGTRIDPYTLIRSPEITDSPMNRSNRNSLENTVIHKLGNNKLSLEYSEKIIAIDLALSCLSDISRKILTFSYCSCTKYTVREIAHKLEVFQINQEGKSERIIYSEKNIERLRAQALIEFAEAYSYENLLVLKK